jgi:hypothetical protein
VNPVSCSEVTDSDVFEVLGDKNIVEFDIAMEHIALLHVQQPDKHLARVCADGCQGYANLQHIYQYESDTQHKSTNVSICEWQ